MSIKIFWGNILRELRKSKNLTQNEIAGLLHISRQAYSSMECGRTQPSAEEIAILSEIYDRDLYTHVINTLPEDMVAEQIEFKTNLPTDKKKRRRKRDSIYS